MYTIVVNKALPASDMLYFAPAYIACSVVKLKWSLFIETFHGSDDYKILLRTGSLLSIVFKWQSRRSFLLYYNQGMAIVTMVNRIISRPLQRKKGFL